AIRSHLLPDDGDGRGAGHLRARLDRYRGQPRRRQRAVHARRFLFHLRRLEPPQLRPAGPGRERPPGAPAPAVRRAEHHVRADHAHERRGGSDGERQFLLGRLQRRREVPAGGQPGRRQRQPGRGSAQRVGCGELDAAALRVRPHQHRRGDLLGRRSADAAVIDRARSRHGGDRCGHPFRQQQGAAQHGHGARRGREGAMIDALMRAYAGHVPGASVLVVRDGQVVVRASYGLADLEARTPVTPRTNFRLASVSKQFTAAAIETLAKRGALGFDDPITRFLPSLPSYARGITIRQLLTHTSGLIDYEDLIPNERTEQVSDLDVLHMLERTDHTLFPPGTKYQYSNTGYVFLGLIVAKASGTSLPEFMKREIFDPLSMHGTAFSPIEHRAYGYTHKSGAWVRRDQSVTS